MKKLKLLESQVQTLVKLPETGMGYQKVKLTFKNGDVLNNMTVLNSEYLVVEEDQIVDIKEIATLELEIK
jgi:hypothetical protein